MRLPSSITVRSRPQSGLPYVLLLSLMFGSSLVSSRIGLQEFSSFGFIGVRMTISSLTFLASFIFFSGRFEWPTDPAVWRHGLVLGVIGTTIPMTAFLTALTYLSSGLAAVIGTISPALTVVLAHFLLKDDRLTGRVVFGVVLALSGALLLVLRGESGLSGGEPANPIGYLLIFLSTISSSLGIIYARRFVVDLSPYQITSVRIFVTMCIMLPVGFLTGGIVFAEVTRVGYTALIYSTFVGSFAGFILSLYIIKRFGVATSVMVQYFMPVVASVVGFLLLDETITGGMLVGMTIIIGGLALINSKPK